MIGTATLTWMLLGSMAAYNLARLNPGGRHRGIHRRTGLCLGRAWALSVVTTLPVIVLVLLVQRHFARALTLGALRG